MSLSQSLGLDLGHKTLEVKHVIKDSQAEELGVIAGSKILKIGNTPVSDFKEFMQVLSDLRMNKCISALILFSMPELNKFPYNKNSKSFRESVFQTNDDDDDDMENKNQLSNDMKKMSGNLLKKGTNMVSPWQNRYFVADNHYLKYYKTEKDIVDKTLCLGVIDLDLCDIKYAEGDKSFHLFFNLSSNSISDSNSDSSSNSNKSSKQEKISLLAATNEEASLWVSILNKLHERYGQTKDIQEATEQNAEECAASDSKPLSPRSMRALGITI